eukprot:4587114-Pyramimonas_sp.AAC.1
MKAERHRTLRGEASATINSDSFQAEAQGLRNHTIIKAIKGPPTRESRVPLRLHQRGSETTRKTKGLQDLGANAPVSPQRTRSLENPKTPPPHVKPQG